MDSSQRELWAEALSGRISRREIIRRGAAIGLAAPAIAAILAACGKTSSSSNPASYGPSDTVIEATTISDAVTLDPNVAYEFASVSSARLMYDTLVRFPFGDLSKVGPSLATKWENSSDGKTWTFHLKSGVKFSSGNTVTAQDFVYSITRVVNLPKDPAAWLITQMGIDSKSVADAVKATDDTTIVMTLPQAFSPGAFLSIMANPVASVVDSKVVKSHVANGDYGTAWLADNSAGSGPYTLSNWTRDVKIEMVLNTKYNLGSQPKIKRILWQNVANNATQLDMLKKGNADMARDLSADQLASLSSDSSVTVFKTPDEAMTYVGMGVKTVPALGNAQVRQAIKYAIDYQGIITNLLRGNGTILQGIIPKGIFGYTDKVYFQRDTTKAKQLLSQAGFGSGFTCTMLFPQGTVAGGVDGSSLADTIRSNLADVGITVNLRQLASSEMYTQYRNHQAELILANWGMDYPDPQDFAAPFGDYSQQSLIWRLQDDNTQLEKLVQQAATMQNTPTRQNLYNQINDLEATDGPFALIYQPDVTIAYSNSLKNLKYDAANGINYPELSKA